MIIVPPPPTVRANVRWSRIRALGRNRLVRSSFIWIAIVPAAAKVIYALRHNVTNPDWAKSAVSSLHLPFSWQILFWSAVCMTLATLLFDLCCPKIIKKHEHFGSFESSGEHVSHLLEYAEQVCKRGSHSGDDFTVYDMTVVNNAYGTSFQHGVGTRTGADLSHSDVFWRVLAVAETHGTGKLRVTFTLYTLGLSLFAIVALQNLWWVVRVLCET